MLRYSRKKAGTPNGERIVKRSSLGETVYVSASYTERDGKTVSRHIFAAGTRIASKVYTKQDNQLTLQNELYYHTDHLGSSSTVSDKNGNFYEKTEYLPYGETWINERQTGDGVAYLFTGKEKDEETGFYYHGARYRDARIGMWLSVDPALEEYLPKPPNSDEAKEHNKKLPGMGGAFNTVNLNLYHYAGNNPVKLIDPDGKMDVDRNMLSDELRMHLEIYDYFRNGSGAPFTEARLQNVYDKVVYDSIGLTIGFLRSYIGISASEDFIKDLKNSRNFSEDRFNKAVKKGQFLANTIDTITVVKGLAKAGMKLSKSELINVLKDPKKRQDFTAGFLEGLLPGPGMPDYQGNKAKTMGWTFGHYIEKIRSQISEQKGD
jgi:RHS repeat-associated protein